MKTVRKIVKIDEELCNGCGQCILDCAEGAIALVGGKARVIADMYCDGLGACLGGCPTGALTIVEREAEAFDEEAVEAHLARTPKSALLNHAPASPAGAHQCGCPGSAPAALHPGGGCPGAAPMLTTPGPLPGTRPIEKIGGPGLVDIHGADANRTWPVKLRLMPAHAPLLKGADILLAADCTAFTAARFHGVLKKDRVCLIACPKFEDREAIITKLADLFANANIRSCVTVRMEVPCCGGIAAYCQEALKRSGKDIPVQHVVVTRQGALVEGE